MSGRTWRRTVLTAATLGGGGLAARAAQVLGRRREVHWTSPGRHRQDAFLSVGTIGRGDQPVLLLHSLTASSQYFGSEFDELGEPGPLVVPDLLGFGQSPASADGYGPDQHVQAILRCLDELEVRGPLLIVGHSVGAVLGLRMAATHPERVRAVVALSPPLYQDSETARRRVRQLVALELGGALDRRLGRALQGETPARLAASRQAARLGRLDLPGQLARGTVQPALDAYRQTLEECVVSARPAEWFSQIKAPVNLVLPAHDPVPDSQVLGSLADRYPNVRLEVLPFGDHRLPLTHPNGCLAAIDRFRATPVSDRAGG